MSDDLTLRCLWEHNGDDTLLWAENLPGCAARGASLDEAIAKIPARAKGLLRWMGEDIPSRVTVGSISEKSCELDVRDSDSDALLEGERGPLSAGEYGRLKGLALKSAEDFLTLYRSVPDAGASANPARTTFYGQVPRTADEMYIHTKNVNSYYFSEIGVDADNEGTIFECRAKGFRLLEGSEGYLDNTVFHGSYGEYWSLRKVLRRFIWHDRIHARAMYRMALRTFPGISLPDLFCFEGN